MPLDPTRRRWLIAATLGLFVAMVLLVQGATLQGDNPWVYRVLMPMEAPAIVIIYAFAGALGLKSLAHPWITATLVNFFFYSLVFYLLLSAFAALARALRRP